MASKGKTPHPWEKNYPKELKWIFKHKPSPLYQLLEKTVAQKPNFVALDFMGQTLTYSDVARQVDAVAAGLQNMGLKKGDRVALCLPNTPYSVVAYFAILKAGGVVVNTNPLYTEDELLHLLKDSGAKYAFALDVNTILPKVQAALGQSDIERIVVCPLKNVLPGVKRFLYGLLKQRKVGAYWPKDGTHIHWDDLRETEGVPKKVPCDPAEDIAVLQYTGGTTGVPKAAMLTHENLTSNLAQVGQFLEASPRKRPEGIAQDVFLCVLPFFHVFAMTALMNLGLAVGGRLVLVPRFEIKDLLKVFRRVRPTLFAGVPTIYTALNTHAKTEEQAFENLRFCIAGGAPLPAKVKADFEALAKCPLVEGYGLSEASPVLTLNPLDFDGVEGSIGVPLPGTVVEIRDPKTGRKCALGKTGELVASGPQVMKGYWGLEAETKNVLKNGKLKTGDLGHMDAKGNLFLTDRLKEVILCGGYNIYPRVIEEVFYTNPVVAECAVIGVPDDYRGETPKVFVSLRPGQRATEDDLLAYAKAKLNPLERPTHIEILDDLPKTLIGKVDKKRLR